MKKLLLETGVSEEEECPFCGYPEASSMYESRSEFTYKKKDFQYFAYCPVCGWQRYGGEDDEEGEITLPPKPKQLIEAKKIISMYQKLSDDAQGIVIDLFMGLETPTFQVFKRGLVDHIF